MAEEDNVTVLEHTELDKEALDQDDMGGIMPPPGQTKAVERLAVIEKLVRDAIANDRKFQASLKDNPNASGYVQFRRYRVTANQPPIMILKEKEIRGDTVIVNYSEATVSIGLHSGITPLGLDTVSIVGASGGAGRTIRTRQALYAVSSVDCDIDIQEEFYE